MAVYFSDIDDNLATQTDGDITKDSNAESVKNSLKNILSTQQGSRRMLPTFAINLSGLLFEPLDEITAEKIGESILDAIDQWEDRIVIENVYVIPKYDDNRYDIKLVFRLINSTETEELDYILTKI